MTDLLRSFTSDKISQLDHDASTVLAAIREWKNSFIRINRLPLDILSLIPTHLSSQRDRLCASFVCRHWRRTFVQRAELWSQLFLSKGEVYVKTFLERAKGTALDIIVDGWVRVSDMMLLASHTEQIKYLAIPYSRLADIRKFSEANPERLPLLHTLRIFVDEDDSPDDFDMITPPSPLLFSNAVNLKVLCFNSDTDLSPSPRPFVFPNLVSFDLFARPFESFRASRLLDFLEASPMLQTVHLKITADVSLEGVPRERVVVLPNVENLTLIVGDGEPGYQIAAHISCPSARSTSLAYECEIQDDIPEGIFPPLVLWNAIIRQHSRSPAEEITLEIKADPVTCKIIFRSADETLVQLGFNVTREEESEFALSLVEIHNKVFTRAARTIQNHPQLASVKRLRICHGLCCFGPIGESHLAKEAGELFKSLGPLDGLTIYDCDPYLLSSLDPPGDGLDGPVAFSPIKELTISHPLIISNEQFTAMITRLAKSRYALGIPFESVIIRTGHVFTGVEES
jgi:hypothetical protein